MKFETLLFTDVTVLSELFIGISIIYLVLHCTFVSIQRKYPLIQSSVLYLCVLVLLFSVYLVYNEYLYVLEFSSFNHTFITDYVSFFAKLVIGNLSLFCLLMIHPYLLNQKINNFEYFSYFWPNLPNSLNHHQYLYNYNI